jgi:hypothetical protein
MIRHAFFRELTYQTTAKVKGVLVWHHAVASVIVVVHIRTRFIGIVIVLIFVAPVITVHVVGGLIDDLASRSANIRGVAAHRRVDEMIGKLKVIVLNRWQGCCLRQEIEPGSRRQFVRRYHSLA